MPSIYSVRGKRGNEIGAQYKPALFVSFIFFLVNVPSLIVNIFITTEEKKAGFESLGFLLFGIIYLF